MAKTKATTTTTLAFYIFPLSRRILITLVGMTLLIENYGVNAAQVPVVPQSYRNCSRASSENVSSISGFNLNNNYVALPQLNADKYSDLYLPTGSFRKSRFFHLFGSNFSLSYNLSLNSGTSAGNFTVVAPAPSYYYVPAPNYYYAPAPGYYYVDPYSAATNYYNPYAYNPYDPYNYYG